VAATKKILFVLILLIYLETKAVAGTKADLQINFMDQIGHNGKQVQDGSGNEHLLVYEPAVYVDSQITKNTNLFANALIDLWTSASEHIFDTNTGASGRSLRAGGEIEDGGTAGNNGGMTSLQNRVAFDIGVGQKIGSWKITPRVGFSTEFDYRSFNGGIRVEKNLLEDNLTLALGYQIFADRALPFDATTQKFLKWQSKTTQSIDASITQILSPSDLILAGYNFTVQSGFLEGTQNTVNVGGTRINEILPGTRDRNAAIFRYVHGWNDWLSTHVDYRFYFDNWGILANTLEPSMYFAFHEDDGLVKLYYRFHQQTASKYYADAFPRRETFMTSDSDLNKFLANEAGALFSYGWNFKDSFVKTLTLSANAAHYQRTNGLRGEILGVGLGGTF